MKNIHMRTLRMTTVVFAAVTSVALQAASLNVSTPYFQSLNFDADKNSGLDGIVVAYNTQDASMTFDSGGSAVTKWERFSQLGGAYAEEIPFSPEGQGKATATASKGDYGYIITTANRTYYYWVTDYSEHRFSLSGVNVSPESDCSSTVLDIECTGSPIHYYGISGRNFTLSSEIKVEYRSLVWDDEEKVFRQDDTETILEQPKTHVLLDATLCDTDYRISGDRFLEAWGEGVSATTASYTAVATEVHATAEQAEKSTEGSNEISSGDDTTLGGSAPADIDFTAYVSDAVIHDEWQIASDPEFDDILYRFNQRDLSYTFRDEGVFYVRFIGSNADGSCEAYSDVFTINIGASELKCPNAFSPLSTPGVNDEWKVSYRSIVSFKCHIFNRYGVEMCSFNDPSLGWDGKYRGKLVKPGVYYYVIDARGADGRHYKLSGDINILDYKGIPRESDSEAEPVTP